MKIAPALLQAIGLALLLPATAAHAQTNATPQKTEVQRVKFRVITPQLRDSLKMAQKDSVPPQPVRKDPKYCPPCGRG